MSFVSWITLENVNPRVIEDGKRFLGVVVVKRPGAKMRRNPEFRCQVIVELTVEQVAVELCFGWKAPRLFPESLRPHVLNEDVIAFVQYSF